jgi:multidrug transporter EmrE-like cation transporter
MLPSTLALILVSVSLSALAQISFKFGVSAVRASAHAPDSAVARIVGMLTTPGVLIGLMLYGVGTLLWLTALSKVEVSQAYPFVGLGFVLTAILGTVLFGDNFGVARGLGIALVIGGIALIART